MDYVELFSRLSRLLFKIEDERPAMAFKEQCASFRLCALDVAAIVACLEADYAAIRGNRNLFLALSELESTLCVSLDLLRWCNETRSVTYACLAAEHVIDLFRAHSRSLQSCIAEIRMNDLTASVVLQKQAASLIAKMSGCHYAVPPTQYRAASLLRTLARSIERDSRGLEALPLPASLPLGRHDCLVFLAGLLNLLSEAEFENELLALDAQADAGCGAEQGPAADRAWAPLEAQEPHEQLLLLAGAVVAEMREACVSGFCSVRSASSCSSLQATPPTGSSPQPPQGTPSPQELPAAATHGALREGQGRQGSDMPPATNGPRPSLAAQPGDFATRREGPPQQQPPPATAVRQGHAAIPPGAPENHLRRATSLFVGSATATGVGAHAGGNPLHGHPPPASSSVSTEARVAAVQEELRQRERQMEAQRQQLQNGYSGPPAAGYQQRDGNFLARLQSAKNGGRRPDDAAAASVRPGAPLAIPADAAGSERQGRGPVAAAPYGTTAGLAWQQQNEPARSAALQRTLSFAPPTRPGTAPLHPPLPHHSGNWDAAAAEGFSRRRVSPPPAFPSQEWRLQPARGLPSETDCHSAGGLPPGAEEDWAPAGAAEADIHAAFAAQVSPPPPAVGYGGLRGRWALQPAALPAALPEAEDGRGSPHHGGPHVNETASHVSVETASEASARVDAGAAGGGAQAPILTASRAAYGQLGVEGTAASGIGAQETRREATGQPSSASRAAAGSAELGMPAGAGGAAQAPEAALPSTGGQSGIRKVRIGRFQAQQNVLGSPKGSACATPVNEGAEGDAGAPPVFLSGSQQPRRSQTLNVGSNSAVHAPYPHAWMGSHAASFSAAAQPAAAVPLERSMPPPLPTSRPAVAAAAAATTTGSPPGCESSKEERTLVAMLAEGSLHEKLAAARQVRERARSDEEARLRLGRAGVIPPLLRVLALHDAALLEAACYALLNLSISEQNKAEMAASGTAQAITRVLDAGSARVKEAAAAVAFSLSSASDETKAEIGAAGAVPFLVQIFIDGSEQAKEDALLALFNLSLVGDNKAALIAAAAPQPIARLLRQAPGHRLAEKAVGTLRNLATRQDGRDAIVDGGALPALAKVLAWGSQRAQDDAAATLLAIARADGRHKQMAAQEAVHVPLVQMLKNGSERGRARAQSLLSILTDNFAYPVMGRAGG